MRRDQKIPFHRSPGFWTALLMGSIAVIAALKLLGAINSSTGFILMAGAAGLMIPLYRSKLAAMRARNVVSMAAANYTRGMMMAAAAYLVGLGLAISLHRNYELTPIIRLVLALLPALPIVGMIAVMAQYLRDETDEYLRHRMIMASLGGLAAVLGIGSFWGFLETFDLVPHAKGWWSVPVWALGVGFTRLWMHRSDAGEGE
ncbi:hypothetical protein [Altererythrobacter sp.]|uniref:hypothetical protein n=1 Tax=Altererythrobacter sp. TaxID=1872480 RepID=UPI003D03A0BE